MDLKELTCFLFAIFDDADELMKLGWIPEELFEKLILVCCEDGIFRDSEISIKEVDGKSCYFNARYSGYRRSVMEYAKSMCILNAEWGVGMIRKDPRIKLAFSVACEFDTGAPEGTLGYFGYSKKDEIKKAISEYLREKGNDPSRISALLNE